MNTTPQAVPDLAIGSRIVPGYRVIAAIREADQPGYLPGCHIVTCEATGRPEYVTWAVAWQRHADGTCDREACQDHGGRWVASAGHYFPLDLHSPDARAEALADMLKRAR